MHFNNFPIRLQTQRVSEVAPQLSRTEDMEQLTRAVIELHPTCQQTRRPPPQPFRPPSIHPVTTGCQGCRRQGACSSCHTAEPWTTNTGTHSSSTLATFPPISREEEEPFHHHITTMPAAAAPSTMGHLPCATVSAKVKANNMHPLMASAHTAG